MGKLKIIECKGYTKDEAFKNLNFDPNSVVISGANATQAWAKAGKPVIGSVAFKRFIIQQLEDKTKNQPGYGVHIVLDPPVQDIRKRPYTIINNKVSGTREWKFIYQIREDILDLNILSTPTIDDDGNLVTTDGEAAIDVSVVSPGMVVEVCSSKSEAVNKVKELITANRRSYTIVPVKVPDIAPIAAFGIYTPSSGAKEGTFIACGIDREELND